MNLRAEVSAGLVKRGFERNGRMHRRRVNQEWLFWVDTGPVGKQSDISPFLGIRHDRTEQLLAELIALPADEWVGTVGANVGYLMGGDFKSWRPPSRADEVLQVIDDALVFLHQFMSLERLPEVWRIKGAKDPLWRYREIVIHVLSGQCEGALECLKVARTIFCENDDEVCEQFRVFAKNTIERIGSENDCILPE